MVDICGFKGVFVAGGCVVAAAADQIDIGVYSKVCVRGELYNKVICPPLQTASFEENYGSLIKKSKKWSTLKRMASL